jgi:hypothetical protein
MTTSQSFIVAAECGAASQFVAAFNLAGCFTLGEDAQIWLALLFGGILGGFLSGIGHRGWVNPFQRNAEKGIVAYDTGWFGDVLMGAAGAIVILLLLPGSFSLTDQFGWIKLLAIGIVGGYGGRRVIEQALAARVEDAERRARDAQKTAAETDKRVEDDAKLASQVKTLLDRDVPMSPVNQNDLNALAATASTEAQRLAFHNAREFKNQIWATRTDRAKFESLRAEIRRVIPIFNALIAADKERQYHRNWGQLGYALKDAHLSLRSAIEAFDMAIAIRDAHNEPGFLEYELNRAICRILSVPDYATTKQPADLVARIKGDLRKAAVDPNLSAKIRGAALPNPAQPEPGGPWYTALAQRAHVNNVSLATL